MSYVTWCDVSNALPPMSGTVLVVTEDQPTVVREALFVHEKTSPTGSHEFRDRDSRGSIERVTHWQPMPIAPIITEGLRAEHRKDRDSFDRVTSAGPE